MQGIRGGFKVKGSFLKSRVQTFGCNKDIRANRSVCVFLYVLYISKTHLSHTSVSVPHLDHHRVGRRCNLWTETTSDCKLVYLPQSFKSWVGIMRFVFAFLATNRVVGQFFFFSASFSLWFLFGKYLALKRPISECLIFVMLVYMWSTVCVYSSESNLLFVKKLKIFLKVK